MTEKIRINKLLSQAGVSSRRGADELISQGKVYLNGKVVEGPGYMVDIEKDELKVNGKDIKFTRKPEYKYYLLNKPTNVVTTVRDTHRRKTVMDIIGSKAKGFFPVGRLDKDTSGLLLITNDGDLAHRLMHPRYEISKVYEVEIDGMIKQQHIEKLERGVNIGDRRPSICKILEIKKREGVTTIIIEIHEGRKRQIRRTFDSLRYKLLSLKRIEYAGLKLDVQKGRYRALKTEEVLNIKKQLGF